VLDRGNTYVALLQHRSHASIANLIRPGGQVNHFREINAVKHNTGIGRGGAQGDFDPASGVQTDPFGTDGFLYGALT
jgi:hypothetical protein